MCWVSRASDMTGEENVMAIPLSGSGVQPL
jgi:hypothetical protein